MSKHVTFLSAAAVLVGVAALPGGVRAADYYAGGDGPLASYSRDGVAVDGDRGERWRDVRPADGGRRAPGPVVFDERAPGRRFDRPDERFVEPGWRRPPAVVSPAEPAYGEDVRPAPFYRPVAVPVGPAFGEGYGGPEEGCTVERTRSITAAGWEKTVTDRTCYRR